MSSYSIYPTLTTHDLMISHPSNQMMILFSTAIGTFLSSTSANTFNQILESPMDSQMTRTRNRPMVKKLISIGHATTFGFITGITGISLLYYIVNPISSYLSALTIFTYVLIYTPLKRISIINTWVGSLVGALPPLIGSISASGPLASQALFQLQSYLIPSLLFIWQFPHFNALSHTIRRDYVKAGYQMCSSLNPGLNARVSFRYSLLCLPLCSVLIPVYELSNWWFSIFSLIPNLYLILPAFKFWCLNLEKDHWILNRVGIHHFIQTSNRSNLKDLEAKKLFWASLIHLPTLLILIMICRP
ncbi:UbiA prenyltransferase family [Melampsora americana]|nr:UbiA prenyltransferase family [Melampsora americana]